ncbi:MAG: D-alanine--D-alanine ligase [Dysgonamonadaceae bacterium]|jgi:D-alanine-D-alanine ligase|nr:D-alanine--D-alanine ligase [Dysgonamonadaceae bacterium]MDD3355945.1 D-alanine--D-alanine ligase [Dysgonamonadaceae bacterium]MDD3726842.1 D-alanine--D-alanine ligase [Dysgonamonadaceae bacterium]MDD4246292.1 D-alanine--D-alanine ligase [Dysgonamonadaceae bacterium]MDD4605403.1 D-alanine--D-alanine ligase [Dysgonamonadaceae bacterium]
MRKKNIAVVWGGYSNEKEVSERSAEGIYNFIDKSRYNPIKVCIDRNGWIVEFENILYAINKNDFSFDIDDKKVNFDFAYIIIHGTPGEDGPLQGYFDMIGIPYSSAGLLSCALTFSKFTCNNFLKSFGFKVADSILIRKNELYNENEIINRLKLPMFVKPNVGGSSLAITKVKNPSQLQTAIDDAFEEASEVLIESFIEGVEVTCGCFTTETGKTILPITEIVPHNEFFDYEAKYEGQVEEITPARISRDMTDYIQNLTSEIYDLVGAKGIARADFIICNNEPILLELNTVPGMTETSFIPQQVEAANLNMTNVLTDIIEYEYNKLENLRNNEKPKYR